MTERPDVAVVMANYNGARYIRAAIQSVLRQTLTSWELIIVDDASSDDSVAFAQDAAAGDPRIRIVKQNANRGPAAARNRALELVTARWIAIFDSDDLMLPPRLATLLRCAEASGATMIADNLLVFSESARMRPFLTGGLSRQTSWISLDAFIRSNCLYARYPDLGYLKPMIRTDILRDAGLRYDETLRIGEDYNFLARLMARGHRLLLEPTGLYLYRKHEHSISHRLRAAEIIALIAAENRFAQEIREPQPSLIDALKRRQRTLRSLLAYDAVIAAIKRGDLAGAARRAAKHPSIWPLLTQPVTTRLRRLRPKSSPPKALDAALADAYRAPS